MKLLFLTKDDSKFDMMKEKLKDFKDLELINPSVLGFTNEEEMPSIEKALNYHELTGLSTIILNSGLYIDKFENKEQPELLRKKVNATETIKNYINNLNKHGGRSLAHYYSNISIINNDGIVTTNTINGNEFLLVNKEGKKVNLKGRLLDIISIDLEAGKYFNDRNNEEIETHYKASYNELIEFIKATLYKNEKVDN